MSLSLVKIKNGVDLERGNDGLLITGDGRSLIDDLNFFLSTYIPHDVMANV